MRDYGKTIRRIALATVFGASSSFVAVPTAQAEDQQLLRELDGYTNQALRVNAKKIAQAKKQMGAGIRG